MNILNLRRKKTTPSANTNQQDTAKTSSSIAENLNSNSNSTPKQPITNEPIQGTPFRVINIPEQGWFTALGKHRIGQLHDNKKAALDELQTTVPWQMICNVIVTLIEQTYDILNNQTHKK